MYIPKHFSENDLNTLHTFIQQYPLALLVMHQAGSLVGSHLPLILDTTQGPYGTLLGHMARGNAQWRTFDGSQEALVIFQGPQSYVSAAWYEHPYANVPTWNYTAIHAYGQPTLMDDTKDLLDLLAVQTQVFEASVANPWWFDRDNERIKSLLQGIIGFKIILTRLEGKFKLSQNRSATDQERVIAALSESEDPMDRNVAEYMNNVRVRLNEKKP